MTTIDWSAPIEAAHEDGRVAEVTVTSDRRDDFILASMPHEFFTYFSRVDGRARRPECGWRIRNVAQQTPTPDVVGEAKDQALELIRQIAGCPVEGQQLYDVVPRARAIVALLPEPVDGDLEIARDIVRASYPDMKDDYHGRRLHIALAAIRRGRALERGEA